jgi:hypothetical protein
MRIQSTLKVLGVFLVFSSAVFAQGSTGSISGVIQDQSGAVLPGARVTITDVDTGISRSAVSDAGGRYRVPSLIPDHYEVQAEMMGFASEIRKGIQLTVGGELEINMALKVGQAAEKVEVTAEAPMVDTQTGTIAGLVDDREIRDLPLNGRSLDQLISLESSAPTFHEKNASAQSGVGVTYSVHGARDQSNQFLLDGMEMIGAYNFGTQPGGALGLNTGVDAIREFSVMTSNYSAAFGKKNGAIINMASKTGANQIHGSAFEFLRNSALDARNFFDKKIPPFRRNQFGGSVGGPIVKDRTFFFFSYEGLRQNLGLSVVETVPDNNARQGRVPNASGQLIDVGVSQAVRPYLSFFPLANGSSFGDGTAQAIFSPNQVSSQDFYLGRVDHRFSDKDSLFVRYTASPAETHTLSDIVYQGVRTNSNLHMFSVQETRIVTPSTVNTIRAGVSRPHTFVDMPSIVPLDPTLAFIPGATSPGQITFALSATSAGAGALTLGQITNTPSGNTNPKPVEVTQYTFGDDLFHQRGPHSLHFGGQVQPNSQVNMNVVQNRFGVFQFANLTSFLQGKPSNFTGPNPSSQNDGTKSFRQTYTAAYVEDDYKVLRNLTLNLGVRWEYMTPPTETHGRISNYHVQVINGMTTLASLPTLGSPMYEGHKNNFAPRVGFAWDIMGDGKTAVRGGVGMFYDQLESEYRNIGYANAPFLGTLQVANPPFPFGFSGGGGSSLPSPSALDTGLDVPTRIQYNLNIQRQITRNTVFAIGYVGSEAYHLTRRGDLNEVVPQILPGTVYFFPSSAGRVNQALASSNYMSSDATASYQGLDVQVGQRLSHGLRYKVSFTWSKEIDTATATVQGLALGNTTSVMEESQLRWDRGLGSFDLRRNVVGNVTYDLPWQNSRNAVARWLGGWQASVIVTVQDGLPFTALTGFNRSGSKAGVASDRPNLLPGVNGVPILGGPNHYYDPTVFSLPNTGFYGNVGRNTLIGPGLAETDVSLTKVFPITEGVKLDFRAEFFNLPNRANFGLPGNQIFTSTGARNGSAGAISTTNTTSRQLQFGLKLLF